MGGEGTDVLRGSHGRDDLFGGPGDGDVLRGDIGFDNMHGGPGARDIASFSTASEAVTVDLASGTASGDGRDTIDPETEDLVGSAYPDTLLGDDAANRIDGGAGYDHLDGRGGSDELFGGPDGASCHRAAMEESCGSPPEVGAGPIVSRVHSIDNSGSLSVRGTSANDSISVSLQGSNFVVGSQIPIPASNAQGCSVSGGAAVCPADLQTILIDVDGGDDSVTVDGSVPRSVEVRIDGGPGADSLNGGPGDDVIEAGDDSSPDRLAGGGGDDALIGARTDLPVPYNSGQSILVGGPGSDVLVGGDPCNGDIFDGGPGNDNANFFRFTPGVFAEIGGAARRSGSPCTPGRVLPSVEALEGSPGPDTLIASNPGDSLLGKGGHDVLIAGRGQSRMVGGGGSDRLVRKRRHRSTRR